MKGSMRETPEMRVSAMPEMPVEPTPAMRVRATLVTAGEDPMRVTRALPTRATPANRMRAGLMQETQARQ
jgi:hypothetical protein